MLRPSHSNCAPTTKPAKYSPLQIAAQHGLGVTTNRAAGDCGPIVIHEELTKIDKYNGSYGTKRSRPPCRRDSHGSEESRVNREFIGERIRWTGFARLGVSFGVFTHIACIPPISRSTLVPNRVHPPDFQFLATPCTPPKGDFR